MSSDLIANAEQRLHDVNISDNTDVVALITKLVVRLKEFEADRTRIEAFVRHKREIGQGGIV